MNAPASGAHYRQLLGQSRAAGDPDLQFLSSAQPFGPVSGAGLAPRLGRIEGGRRPEPSWPDRLDRGKTTLDII